MRYAEFDAILRDLQIAPRMDILDVSSPQWFSLYLAATHPEAKFRYINILDAELDPYKEVADALGIKNLTYQRVDVRDMEFGDNSFQKVISISVIEHVYPEEDGDLRALKEIRRVLLPDGDLLLTVPYKTKSRIVYMDGPVYERGTEGRNFFAREYDRETFDTLVARSGFTLKGSWFIYERKGLCAMDYYQSGAGKDTWPAKYVIKSRRLVERLLGRSLDEALAKQCLSVSQQSSHRLANISATLKKV